MINSVYDILDRYKRQGRINPQAAMRGLASVGVHDCSNLRGVPATPDREYLLDCFSIAAGLVGGMISHGAVGCSDWNSVKSAVRSTLQTVDEVWKSQGRVIHIGFNAHEAVRRYIADCVWYYRSGGQEKWPKYSALVEEAIRTRPEDMELRNFLEDDAIYYFLSDFLNGINADRMNQILRYWEIKDNGYLIDSRISDRPGILVSSQFDGWGCRLFAVHWDSEQPSNRSICTGDMLDSLRLYDAKTYQWFMAPSDLSLCEEDMIYGIVTPKLLVAWGKDGMPIRKHRSAAVLDSVVKRCGLDCPRHIAIGVESCGYEHLAFSNGLVAWDQYFK